MNNPFHKADPAVDTNDFSILPGYAPEPPGLDPPDDRPPIPRFAGDGLPGDVAEHNALVEAELRGGPPWTDAPPDYAEPGEPGEPYPVGGSADYEATHPEQPEPSATEPNERWHWTVDEPAGDERTELVNHPLHYGGDTTYEVIKVIEAWELDFNLGNAVKYVARAKHKGTELDDLRKAAWYLERAIQRTLEAGQ